MADEKLYREELVLVRNLVRALDSTAFYKPQYSVLKGDHEEWMDKEGFVGKQRVEAWWNFAEDTRSSINDAITDRRRRLAEVDEVLAHTLVAGIPDPKVGERFRAMLVTDIATLESLLPKI